jgi:transposase-like protein
MTGDDTHPCVRLVQPAPACARPDVAAKRFFRCLLNGLENVSRVIVTDKLRSCGVAKRHLLPTSSIDKADI